MTDLTNDPIGNDTTIAEFVAVMTGVAILPTEEGRSIPLAAHADVEFARTVSLDWQSVAGDTYGLLAAERSDLEERQ